MNKILTVCLVIVAIFAIATLFFKVPVNSVLVFGGILLCPLMHLFMMHHGSHSEKTIEDHTNHKT